MKLPIIFSFVSNGNERPTTKLHRRRAESSRTGGELVTEPFEINIVKRILTGAAAA